MSQITTHVLDTSMGKPAKGIQIHLEEKSGSDWKLLGSGITNDDGRIADLLSKDVLLKHGIYKLTFEVKPYFDNQNLVSFYPSVTVEFEVKEDRHYHVPLLLNPFGYSTYRGS
jgi:5-hydroxyisourate hydrolase